MMVGRFLNLQSRLRADRWNRELKKLGLCLSLQNRLRAG